MVNYEKNVMKFSINLIENTLELLLKIIAAGYVSIAIKFQVKLFVDFFFQVRNPAFNRVVQRLKHRESLENLVAACPDLAKVSINIDFLNLIIIIFSL
jgi:hypothetical protein